MKVDILVPIRFCGPHKWADLFVKAFRKNNVGAKKINNFTGIIRRFFYTDADVIISTLPLFFNLQGKPIILTLKGDYRREESIWKYIWPFVIKKSRIVIVPSEFLKKELNLKDAIVIPNGEFLQDFKQVKHKNKKVIRIVTVTRFHYKDKANGVLELLKILNIVHTKSKKKFEFVVVGDGRFLEYVKKKSVGFNIPITFTGFSSNPEKILEKSDIYTYYSYFDSFGISLIEAMSCGLPVVANDYGPTKEIIQNEKEGLVTNNRENFADYIIKLFNLKYRIRIGKNSINKIKNKFNWDHIIGEYIKICKNEIK